MNKPIEYYLNLPYTLELIYDPDQAWFVRVKELPGCTSQGDTPNEAIEMIKDAMQVWLEIALEDGDTIPEPRPDEDYSGKFVVRVPKSLHRQLVEAADAEEVSLNQYINVALSQTVGTESIPLPAVKTQEPGANVFWPGLENAIHSILASQGKTAQAGQIDERLFAEWSGQKMHELADSYRQGRFSEALSQLQVLLQIFRENAWRSAAINLWVQMLSFQKQIIQDMQQQQEEAAQEAQVLSQVGDMLRQINRGQLQGERSRASYSQAAMKPELALQAGLFGSKVQVTDHE